MFLVALPPIASLVVFNKDLFLHLYRDDDAIIMRVSKGKRVTLQEGEVINDERWVAVRGARMIWTEMTILLPEKEHASLF